MIKSVFLLNCVPLYGIGHYVHLGLMINYFFSLIFYFGTQMKLVFLCLLIFYYDNIKKLNFHII